jgi:ABC-type glycerol-3-phosphate transport system permease component
MKQKRIGFNVKKLPFIILAIFLIIVCVGPVFFVFWNASKTTDEYYTSKFSPPKNFKIFIENVKIVFERGLFRQLLNTIIVTILTIFVDLIFCSMSGFAFAKLKIPGKNFLYWITISMLALPTQIFLIPLYVMFSKFHMINNPISLVLIYAGFNFAFGTFLMKSFYTKTPNELLESAKIDGASNFMIYLKIMLPMGKPALITLGVLDFFGTWNELLLSLIFNQKSTTRLITPGLALFQQAQKAGAGGLTQWPLIFSGIIMSLIIPITIYIIFQNKIASGLTIGALKE